MPYSILSLTRGRAGASRRAPSSSTGTRVFSSASPPRLLALLSAALLVLGFDAARAQSCSITPANGNYGSVNVLSGAAVTTTAPFTIACTGTKNRTVQLCVEFGPGNQTNASGHRVLVNGANQLLQEFYTSAAETTVWGSWGASVLAYTPYPYGTTVSLPLGSTGSASVNLTVYGSVLANQATVVPGSYLWNSTGTPGVEYGYAPLTGSPAACPTGTATTNSGGSNWTATVVPQCYVTATTLNFGSIGVISANVNATSTISVQCTNTTPYTVALGNGLYANGSQRQMLGGATNSEYVSYNLYSNASLTAPWTSASTVSGTGTGAVVNTTLYGQIPSGQSTPSPGTYNDTVIVTVSY